MTSPLVWTGLEGLAGRLAAAIAARLARRRMARAAVTQDLEAGT